MWIWQNPIRVHPYAMLCEARTEVKVFNLEFAFVLVNHQQDVCVCVCIISSYYLTDVFLEISKITSIYGTTLLNLSTVSYDGF